MLEDLQPFPGRAGLTWRIALLCALVTGAAMMFEIPEAAISCYLIIFLMKPDAVANIGTGIGFLLLLPGLIALLAWIINLTQGSTLHIMLAIVISSCLLLYLGAATQLGEQGNVMALIIAFVLTLIVKAPFGDAATFALREAWAMAALPMLLMIGFNLLLGFSPVRLLRDKLRARLAAAAEALETGDRAELRELLREGNAPFEPQALAARLLRLVPRADARQIAADLRAGYALMLAVSALPDDLDPARRAALADQIRAAHDALGQGEAPAPVPAPAPAPPRSPSRTRLIAQSSLEDDAACADEAEVDPAEGAALNDPAERAVSGAAEDDPAEQAAWAAACDDPAERAAWDALNVLAGAPEAEVVPAPKTPFVAPDALSNPAYIRLAFKTTAAAVICFLIYTAIDWQGIHTAMVTCYVAALGTTGETLHKLTLRIIGCLIGAAIGVAAIFWVIPHIDGIGALMALVFFGCLVGAWVSTGPERLSYAGVQVALAFLLTVLQGFGPSVSLDTAQGRIVGILLGNLVVYLIFTRLWPAPIVGEARALFARALSGLAGMARLAPSRRPNALSSAAAIESLAGKGEEVLRLLPFEPRALRPTPVSEASLHGAVAEIEALNRAIWLSRDADLAQTAEQLDRLAERFYGPAEEPGLAASASGSNSGSDCGLNPNPCPASSPTLHAGLATFVGPFSRQLNQLERAAG
ncbi:MAG: FUSC family protein [Chromatiaceae bacterium]|nr:FUSC family protein [Chromatiaceae bacterium]